MLVTNIVKKDSKKSIVFIDYEKAFALYHREIKRFSIQLNKELSTEAYEEILREILPKRCMERALYLLQSSDKTECDLRNKLEQGTYPQAIINRVMEKLKSYGYIDDYRYTYHYVQANLSSKSAKRIVFELTSKGVQKDIIDRAFKDYREEDDAIEEKQRGLIKKEFEKRKFDFSLQDKVLFNKIVNSLLRKGFRYDDIMHVYYELEK